MLIKGMPYLNWKEREIQNRIEAKSDAKSTLMLTLEVEERSAFIPFLEEIYFRGGSELRVDFPENWIVFGKHGSPKAVCWLLTLNAGSG